MTYFVGYEHIRFKQDYETLEDAENIARESSQYDGPFEVWSDNDELMSVWYKGIGYFPKTNEVANDPT